MALAVSHPPLIIAVAYKETVSVASMAMVPFTLLVPTGSADERLPWAVFCRRHL